MFSQAMDEKKISAANRVAIPDTVKERDTVPPPYRSGRILSSIHSE
jgi:hypothetical protein